MKLTFIVPCYNEEKNVRLIYDDVVKNFKNKNYDIELIFINDGSKDNTLIELKKLVKQTTKMDIKIINFSRNFGKEAGMYAGLKESTGDYVVTIDGDMQQPPSFVLKMLDIFEKDNNVDIVACYQEKRIESKFISFFKAKFYKIISKLTGLTFVNGASDFRLIKRIVVDNILKLSEHNRFSKGIFSWIGFNTYYIPYIPSKRASGNTSWNFKSLFKYALSGILSFIKNPMKIVFNFGLINILISIIWWIILIINSSKIIYYLYPFILLLFGINFIILWYIGLFINRGYEEAKNRPIYIVKEVITNEKNN